MRADSCHHACGGGREKIYKTGKKETEKICETFAGRMEDIVARDAAEREEKECQKIA